MMISAKIGLPLLILAILILILLITVPMSGNLGGLLVLVMGVCIYLTTRIV